MTNFDSASQKREYVKTMFGRIAPRYDLMNRLMTGGQDRRWRRKLVREADLPAGGRLLDVATGTGDVAYAALQVQPLLDLVVGTDFSQAMLTVARRHDIEDQAVGNIQKARWTAGDTVNLPFPDNSFDALTSAFLMRNVVDLKGALTEQRRVVRPGGRVLILEITRPRQSVWGRLFRIYFHQIVPWLGNLISGQRDAYRYLPQSADAFLRPEELANQMEAAGLLKVRYSTLMLGTVALHVGIK